MRAVCVLSHTIHQHLCGICSFAPRIWVDLPRRVHELVNDLLCDLCPRLDSGINCVQNQYGGQKDMGAYLLEQFDFLLNRRNAKGFQFASEQLPRSIVLKNSCTIP